MMTWVGEGAGEGLERRIGVYLGLIHVVVQQKPTTL